MSQSGTLGYKRIVQRFLKSAGHAAILKDITFNVYDSDEDIISARKADTPRFHVVDEYVRDHDRLGSLRLSIKPNFTAVTTLNALPSGKSPFVEREDVAAAFADVERVARDIVGE